MATACPERCCSVGSESGHSPGDSPCTPRGAGSQGCTLVILKVPLPIHPVNAAQRCVRGSGRAAWAQRSPGCLGLSAQSLGEPGSQGALCGDRSAVPGCSTEIRGKVLCEPKTSPARVLGRPAPNRTRASQGEPAAPGRHWELGPLLGCSWGPGDSRSEAQSRCLWT